MALAKILQEETGVRPVTLEDLCAISSTEVWLLSINNQFFIKCLSAEINHITYIFLLYI